MIAGHCLGAGIAAEFAVRQPGRAAGLILIEPVFRQALTGGMRRLARFRRLFILLARLVLGVNSLGVHRRRLAPLDLEALDRETRALMAEAGSTEALARYASPLLDLRTTATAVYLQDLIALTGPTPEMEAIRAPALALVTPGGDFTDPAITSGWWSGSRLPGGLVASAALDPDRAARGHARSDRRLVPPAQDNPYFLSL